MVLLQALRREKPQEDIPGRRDNTHVRHPREQMEFREESIHIPRVIISKGRAHGVTITFKATTGLHPVRVVSREPIKAQPVPPRCIRGQAAVPAATGVTVPPPLITEAPAPVITPAEVIPHLPAGVITVHPAAAVTPHTAPPAEITIPGAAGAIPLPAGVAAIPVAAAEVLPVAAAEEVLPPEAVVGLRAIVEEGNCFL